MDDYHTDSLIESRNEWMSRFVNILTPLLNEGIQSIFSESFALCKQNNEVEKYLMTFQNFLSRVPSWNQTIVENECQRLIDKSKCNYLNDLLTCVHVIQLKMLTNVRVSSTQKQVNIDIPKLENYVHRVYINIARKLYKCVYLFENDCSPLQKQKNNREVETIIRECIVNTIRDTIPIEKLLTAYMGDEMVEEIEKEQVKSEASKETSNSSEGENTLKPTNTTTTTNTDDKQDKSNGSTPNLQTLATPKEAETKADLISKTEPELPPVLPAELNPPKKESLTETSDLVMDITTKPETVTHDKILPKPIDTNNLTNTTGNISPPQAPTRSITEQPKSILEDTSVSFDLNKNTVKNIERNNTQDFTNFDDDDETVKITGEDIDIMDDVEELDF